MTRWTGPGLAVTAATAIILSATGAMARDACPPRGPSNVVPLPTTNMQSDLVTLLSLGPSVTDKAIKRKALLKLTAKCEDPGFQAGGLDYALFETTAASPVMAARSPNPEAPILYLAPFDDLTGAVMAEIEKRAATPASRRYVLVVSTTAAAAAVRVYDGVPAAAPLRDDMIAALTGRLSPLVSSDSRTKNVQINVQASAYDGPSSQPGARPPPGTGVGPPAISGAPQNESFREQADGGALHPPSGFTCPAKLEGFERNRLTVYDAAEGGRDVSCGYASPNATATLYLTRLPSQFTVAKVFDTYVEQAKGHTPAVADAPDPYPQSEGGPTRKGRFWLDKEGRGEGLWLMQIGPWFAKLRVTYGRGEAGAIRPLAIDLLKAINAQIKPPSV